MLAATQGTEGLVVAPSVLTRLVGTWLLGSGLPCLAIAGLVLTRSNGWIIQKTGSVEMPILVVTLVAILIGLPVMIMTSRSISDPVREVVDAMAQVERGKIDTFVGVYEKSEIGRLQDGFNRMVAGIGERDRLRDLFGRHVGADVARRAIEEGTSLSGDVREAAILVHRPGRLDDAGGEPAAARGGPGTQRLLPHRGQRRRRPPRADQQIPGRRRAGRLRGAAGPRRSGVGRAGHRLDCSVANCRQLPQVDFGIGVSAGPVFAGNIGAENRYEYTVVGDAVNEAARLADFAKTLDQRIVCSASAIDRAEAVERAHWVSDSETVRAAAGSDTTYIWTPATGE